LVKVRLAFGIWYLEFIWSFQPEADQPLAEVLYILLFGIYQLQTIKMNVDFGCLLREIRII
jgi:uncharacterized protein YhhL (DUF1145 family)